MNTATLKTFAPAVRRQLMEAVSRKLDFVLSAQTPDYLSTFSTQVAALRKAALADREGLVERVSYTWFNRFTALRYLDARGWHPFRCRVLTAANSAETQPEILKLVRSGSLPAELREHTNSARLNDLIDGRFPSSDPQGEVYRHLVLAACRYYHALLPDLFERLDDETELLLPDDVLTEHSVVQRFRTEVTDEDCAEVEMLGWLYQFYISEKKDEVMARKSAVPGEDIPAVTQLFTPHWIVRYLVENSLGRLWLLNRPNSQLREKMPYYIEGAPETGFLRIAGPEEIRVLDPAVGSGHILTYAFELLHAIYEEEGYAASEIPGLILANNLYGLDICPRATQLAALALALKARDKARGFFQRDKIVSPRVTVLQSLQFDDSELLDYGRESDLGHLFNQLGLALLNQFAAAAILGSLIRPCMGEHEIRSMRRAIEQGHVNNQLFQQQSYEKIIRALGQAELLSQRYHVVIANPPYMGSSQMTPRLRDFVSREWKAGSADSYAAFILRNLILALRGGFVAMITIPNWMFLSTFETLRKAVLATSNLSSLVHCGRGVWGSDFGSCAFVIETTRDFSGPGHFKRLFGRQGEVQTNEELDANFFNSTEFPTFSAKGSDFQQIAGSPIAYWVSPAVRLLFATAAKLEDVASICVGLQTGDNGRFLRIWTEVSADRIGFGVESRSKAAQSGRKWFPYNKGGEWRKWYGNNTYVVNWENDGEEISSFRLRSRVQNAKFYFRESVTWSFISASAFGVRYSPAGFIFDVAGSSAFPSPLDMKVVVAYLCSSLGFRFMQILNPTVNFQVGDVAKLPWDVQKLSSIREEISAIAEHAIRIARRDWDSAETSWDFSSSPLLHPDLKSLALSESWQKWKTHCDVLIGQMRVLETKNNSLLASAFGLESEIHPEVPEGQITLIRADRRKDMAAFLSYSVACMMGRYSLDQPGLVLANAGDGLVQYATKVGLPLEQFSFAPDADGIVPVLDGEWFEDDVVARVREFLRVTFGEPTFRENLRFIEESLGKDLRKYFLTDFYKDHLQTYKKRPIYWMVQSPRKGFSVLIYLHRYTRDTMNIVLNRYLREYQAKLRSRIAQLSQVAANESANARDKTAARKESDKLMKTLRECEEWERETLLPLAQARIELDLDDGVKVNYLKLGDALAPIPGLAAKDDD